VRDVEVADDQVLPAATGRRSSTGYQLSGESGQERHLAFVPGQRRRRRCLVPGRQRRIALRNVDAGHRDRRIPQIDLKIASLARKAPQLTC